MAMAQLLIPVVVAAKKDRDRRVGMEQTTLLLIPARSMQAAVNQPFPEYGV